MARREYSEEFRIEAVNQVTKNGYSVKDTAERLGIHPTFTMKCDLCANRYTHTDNNPFV